MCIACCTYQTTRFHKPKARKSVRHIFSLNSAGTQNSASFIRLSVSSWSDSTSAVSLDRRQFAVHGRAGMQTCLPSVPDMTVPSHSHIAGRWPCHGSGGFCPAPPRKGQGLITVQSLWDFRNAKWHSERYPSPYFGFYSEYLSTCAPYKLIRLLATSSHPSC
jgi:hypothetical protein